MNLKCIRIIFFCLAISFPYKLYCQIPSFAGGLAFSSGVYYNELSTGNPAIFGMACIKLNEKLKLVPGLTAYNVKKRSYPAESATLKNYMFQGDIDVHYSFYKDHPLRFIGLAGLNATSIFSRWEIDQDLGQDVENKSGLKLGLNLGGAVYMFVDNKFDAYVSGKYIASGFDQFVINVGIVYYAEGLRRKGGW
jgi:hypothetical protein